MLTIHPRIFERVCLSRSTASLADSIATIRLPTTRTTPSTSLPNMAASKIGRTGGESIYMLSGLYYSTAPLRQDNLINQHSTAAPRLYLYFSALFQKVVTRSFSSYL